MTRSYGMIIKLLAKLKFEYLDILLFYIYNNPRSQNK